ncbi:MAG: DNA-processing protein DprA [Clostridiales bacterium]|nr:DNA-processing protein DprA [Clostridiales bacterium]
MKKEFSLWLSEVPELSRRMKCRLETALGSSEAVYYASEQEILALAANRTENDRLKSFLRAREAAPSPGNLRIAAKELEDRGINWYGRGDSEYPENLKNIPDPPFVIFAVGRIPKAERYVGIVGSRRASHYGSYVAGEISGALAGTGAVLVSGMARGIDSISQRRMLELGGTTIAVLGSGPDICYPPECRNLYREITRTGGVISEYCPGTPPAPYRFPERNRIISGICDTLVVVEAGSRSGSLITADMALDQGREVYAVPGRIDDILSNGCNDLIRQGAGIITSVEAFLKEAFLTNKEGEPQIRKKIAVAKNKYMLYSCFHSQPRKLIDAAREAELDYREAVICASEMEMEGFIRQVYPGSYVIVPGGMIPVPSE